jgi:glucose/arabinose dehydrogenase
MNRWLRCIVLVALLCVSAQNTPRYALSRVAGGFSEISDIVQVPDGSGRLFVVQVSGLIRIIDGKAVLSKPFLDVNKKLRMSVGGQGLLGLVFHPDYAKNGFFYINYVNVDGWPVLVRYQVSSNDPNVANPFTERILLTVAHPGGWNFGGQLAFGPDGYLYYSTGDDFTGKTINNAQNMQSFQGAIIRLDVNKGLRYEVPADNPSFGPYSRPELWAKGLRNPWRFSFDKQTGDLYITDTGDKTEEEINFQPAGSKGGQNYGWDFFEGTMVRHEVDRTGLTFPIVRYDHSKGDCSVTGGYVYRGRALPELAGYYLFGDYCSGRIWTTHRTADGAWITELLLNTGLAISTFAQDSEGELYIADYTGGVVYKLVAAN